MHRAGAEQQQPFGFTQQAIEDQPFGWPVGKAAAQVVEA